MPKKQHLKTVLIIGSGPIIIGQACEFDYSGTQACKALKDEGYKVILVNSNPATIMTDPDIADKTYIEPITLEVLEKIIIKEKPDSILPTMGGQTALNLAMEAEKKEILRELQYSIIDFSLSCGKHILVNSSWSVSSIPKTFSTYRPVFPVGELLVFGLKV